MTATAMQLVDEHLDAPCDLVPDRPDLFDRSPGRVIELPVEVALARVHRAGIATAHRDDIVAVNYSLIGENFWRLR